MAEFLKAILLGILEGVTEWLPISSTGHMILAEQLIHVKMSPAFQEMFLVLVQLGAIMAVVALYWKSLIPFTVFPKLRLDREKWAMWLHILAASIPAGLVGILWEPVFTKLFYNYQTVAFMLIFFGLLFLLVEAKRGNRTPLVNKISQITYRGALFIGLFQMLAAVFPGTSRSGATILGALLIGISRTAAAEFTFFLAIPAMLGASLLKLLKFGFSFTPYEFAVLMAGMATAYLVSVLSIRFLVGYIRAHSFRVFGWYRILLGLLVLGFFQFTS